jgi:hypothetical protein
MYDAQVLKVIQEMDKPTPKEPTEAEGLLSIWTTIKGISIEGAISILDTFGYDNDQFYDREGKWNTHDLAKACYFPECEGRRADETPKIIFWGGPPNALTWYPGTLYTLLRDRIFCEMESRGVAEVARYIGTDLTTVEC